MRDIRDDLKERLAAIDAEADKLKAQLESLSLKKAPIQKLLQEEDARFAKSDQVLFAGVHDEPGKYSTPLSRIILGKIRLNGGIASLEDLKQAAEDAAYNFGEKQPGRSIHFALIGMAQSGLVESMGDSVWKLKEAQTLNGVH
jgi:hypothetical protein